MRDDRREAGHEQVLREPAGRGQGLHAADLEGKWYKVLGYNPKYDTYPCQINTFSARADGGLDNDILFRVPKPGGGGGAWQNNFVESMADSRGPQGAASMTVEGKMFGLTFHEQWYVIGGLDSKPAAKADADAGASGGGGGGPESRRRYRGDTQQGRTTARSCTRARRTPSRATRARCARRSTATCAAPVSTRRRWPRRQRVPGRRDARGRVRGGGREASAAEAHRMVQARDRLRELDRQWPGTAGPCRAAGGGCDRLKILAPRDTSCPRHLRSPTLPLSEDERVRRGHRIDVDHERALPGQAVLGQREADD